MHGRCPAARHQSLSLRPQHQMLLKTVLQRPRPTWIFPAYIRSPVVVALVPYALGFPEYRSLAGLSPEEVRAVARTFSSTPGAQPVPPPIKNTAAKLVYDAAHPFQPNQPGDIRGPCPGLNTLASHGYLPYNGVATPAEIINATQEGFNMGWNLAAFVTYGAFIVDGNHLTNLMSIGANTTAKGELTPGLNIHGNFEGDASTTRGDYYFGDNYNFNETLFDQLEYAANLVGHGLVTVESSSLQKALRINDSIARNPTFSFDTLRYLTAYAETTFPLAFFVSNQMANTTLNVTLDNARSFFQTHQYPEGFYRRQAPYDFNELSVMFAKIYELVQVPPGYNDGVGNYVVNLDDDDGSVLCYAYQKQVNLTAQLYPDPTSELETAIKANLATFYQLLPPQDPPCKQLFPFGH
ncbi:heme-thiolate peroxidase [Boletus coccyginus]|nr:heme-thiolate peroxidase [Boletus coccyginus]